MGLNTRRLTMICLFLLFFLLFNTGTLLIAATLTSTENVTISAIVAGTTPSSSVASGSVVGLPKTSVRFSGEAYPNATVSISKNGTNLTSVKADLNGFFSVTLEEKYDSTTLYSLYARDILGNKSLLINYPIVVTAGYLTYLSGIRFPPTITLDKAQVREGDYLTVSGYALPTKELQVVVEDKNKKFTIFTLNARDTGRYDIILPLVNFPKDNYSIYIKYINDTRQSKLVNFGIGDTNILSADATLNITGDCNADEVINLTDFSVLAFWYKKTNPPTCVDVNKDNIVNLTDFSILAFYWTG